MRFAVRLLARLDLLQRSVIHWRWRTPNAWCVRWLNVGAGTVVSRTPFLRIGFNQGQTGAVEHGLAFRQQLLDRLAHDYLLWRRSGRR